MQEQKQTNPARAHQPLLRPGELPPQKTPSRLPHQRSKLVQIGPNWLRSSRRICTSCHGPKDGLVWVYCAAGAWQGGGGPRLSTVIPRQKAPGAGGGNRKRAPAVPLSTFSTSKCCFMAVRESLTTHLLPHSPSGGDSRSLAGVTQGGTPGEMVQKHKSPACKARSPPVIPHII